MNLLFVYPQAIIPNRGGTERVAYTIANALKKRGHRAWFMATKSGKEDASLSQNPEYILISKELTDEKRKQIVIDTSKQLKIDVIINEGGEFEDFAIFSNRIIPWVKIITCLHFDVFGEINYFRRDRQYRNLTTSRVKFAIIEFFSSLGLDPYRLKFFLSKRKKYRTMLQVSDAVVVVTPVIARQLKRITGIASDKIFSILNPVTLGGEKATYDAEAKEKMLLYAGRFSPDKNVDKILLAWAELAPRFPDWKLEIAGDGEMRDALHALVEQQKIPRVHFHGHITDMVGLYKRAEYVLLASDCESFSCVVLEGYQHGCYPIVFDYPSAQVILPSDTFGTRIKNHSAKALAQAISTAIKNNKSNKHELSAISHHLELFQLEKTVDKWDSLLHFLQQP